MLVEVGYIGNIFVQSQETPPRLAIIKQRGRGCESGYGLPARTFHLKESGGREHRQCLDTQ